MMKINFGKLKLNQAIGLPRPPSNKQKSEAISNVKDDENQGNSSRVLLPYCLKTNEVTASDQNYTSWVMQHPSALGSFDRMMKAVKGNKIVVFLDYDGTLSPIVDDPDTAFMSNEMRAAVRGVAKCFPTAIISGRSIDKVKDFVQLSNVYYAGSHGMDIMVPPPRSMKFPDGKYCTTSPDKKGDGILFQPAKKFLPAIEQIYKLLKETTNKIEGAMVEDNRFCVSVHFRQVKEEDYGILEEKVKTVLKSYPELHLSRGKKVMEIRPSIEWDKGHALEYFLDTFGFSDSSDVIPLHIGDDRTDEDAFKVIRRRGQGYPILVSSIPKETKAQYSLKDPSDVLSFLLRLARWRRSSSSSRSLSQIWGIGN